MNNSDNADNRDSVRQTIAQLEKEIAADDQRAAAAAAAEERATRVHAATAPPAATRADVDDRAVRRRR